MQVQKISFSSLKAPNTFKIPNWTNSSCAKIPEPQNNRENIHFSGCSIIAQKNPAFLGTKKRSEKAATEKKEDPFKASIKELPEDVQLEIAKTNVYIDRAFPSIPKELETIHYPTIEECLDIIKKRAKLDSFDSYFEEIKSFPKNNIEYRELPNSTDLISVYPCVNINQPLIKLSDAKHNLIYEFAEMNDGYEFTDYINMESFNYVSEKDGGIATKIIGDIMICYGRNNKYATIMGPSVNEKCCGYYHNGSVVRYSSGDYLKKEETFSLKGEKISETYYLDNIDREYHTKYVHVKPTT